MSKTFFEIGRGNGKNPMVAKAIYASNSMTGIARLSHKDSKAFDKLTTDKARLEFLEARAQISVTQPKGGWWPGWVYTDLMTVPRIRGNTIMQNTVTKKTIVLSLNIAHRTLLMDQLAFLIDGKELSPEHLRAKVLDTRGYEQKVLVMHALATQLLADSHSQIKVRPARGKDRVEVQRSVIIKHAF